MQTNAFKQHYVGRFAPSPTGSLHFGSLVAAVASFLQARSKSGHWILRIDDIDPPRQVDGSAESIIRDLARFGIQPDLEVDYQSTRFSTYRAARDRLVVEGKAYHCGCSRAELPADGSYPGTCRDGLPKGKEKRSVRIRTDSRPITFRDGVQGSCSSSLNEVQGDFVIWRADDLPSYQLAAALDDASPGITEVVRGADLLDSTFRQIHLQRQLGLDSPRYAHIPVAAIAGSKLSKRLKSDPLTNQRTVDALRAALQHLGHLAPRSTSLDELWKWAIEAWDLARVPRLMKRDLPEVGDREA